MLSQPLVILLRIIHITLGVSWAGSIFFFVFFVEPSSRALGPAAAPFMQELIGKRKVIKVLLWLATGTILAGLILYWNLWQAFGGFGGFIGTGFGLGLTIGGVVAIAAFLIGMFGTRPNVKRLMAAAKQAADGPPSPEAAAEIQLLQGRLRFLARASLVLIVVAVAAMATARYW